MEQAVALARLSREGRQAVHQLPDKPIRDIRLFFKYALPPSLFYLRRYADLVLHLLTEKGLLCPHYDHVYIRIADSEKDALANVVVVEDWYTYGIAVLKEETLLAADHAEQQALVLNAIKEGLLDIAALDKLDGSLIHEAIREASAIGLLAEMVYKTKENNTVAFTISTRIIQGANEEEIYFSITDKRNNRIAKWKFGQENIFLIRGWFGNIQVTGKKIRIKPRPNMDAALGGRQKIIELDVLQELAAHGNSYPTA